MGYLEILGLVVSGAGTMASILGIFFAVYAKQNGRMTRDLIRETQAETQNLIKEIREETQAIREETQVIREEIREMREETQAIREETRGIRDIIVIETRLTRELIERIDERAHRRHEEVIEILARKAA